MKYKDILTIQQLSLIELQLVNTFLQHKPNTDCSIFRTLVDVNSFYGQNGNSIKIMKGSMFMGEEEMLYFIYESEYIYNLQRTQVNRDRKIESILK